MPDPKPEKKPQSRKRPRSNEGPAVPIPIRLAPSEHRVLLEEAARQGVSASEVVRQALVARGIIPGANEAK